MKQKLLYISLILSILPLILFQIYFFYTSERMNIEREIDNDFQEIKSSSVGITEKISFFRDNMRLVSKLSLLRVSLEYNRPETVNEFLGSEGYLRKNFSKLYVLDKQKNFFTSHEESPEVFTLIENSKIFFDVSTSLDVSKQKDIVTEHNSFIYIATKIYDENEQVSGYLIGEINPTILTDEIERLKTRIKGSEKISIGPHLKSDSNMYCQAISIDRLTESLCFQKKYKETFIDTKFVFILLISTSLLALIFGSIYRVFFSKILKPFYDFLDNLQAVTTGTYTLIDEKSKYPEIETLIKSSNQIVSKLKSYQNEEIEKEKNIAVSKMATQAAHDIRSPLEVLKSLEDDLRKLPEESRKRLKLGIARIEEIAYNLLQVNKGIASDSVTVQSEDLLQLISATVIEKSIEYRHLERIRLQSNLNQGYGLFSSVNRTALKSIISNLINNSVESSENEINVTISLSNLDSNNIIRIADTGPGIDHNILDKLLTTSFTSKSEGNGLGLRNAYLDIKKWGGTIKIDSPSKNGTIVNISLPSSVPTPFFLPDLNIAYFEEIFVVDDDPGFLEIWKQKLIEFEGNVIFTSKISSHDIKSQRTLVISDYDLGEGVENGIEILHSLPSKVTKVLTTALSEDDGIRKSCIENGIKLLPKNSLNFLPIARRKITSILIDDDKLMHINWKLQFEKAGKDLLTFYSVADFVRKASDIDQTSIIYIDSNLSNEIKGELESEQIYRMGFKTIFLSTGYSDFDLKLYPWIKGVLGKSPPT